MEGFISSTTCILLVSIGFSIGIWAIYSSNIDNWSSIYSRPVLMAVLSVIGSLYLIIVTLQLFDYDVNKHLTRVSAVCSFLLGVSICAVCVSILGINY